MLAFLFAFNSFNPFCLEYFVFDTAEFYFEIPVSQLLDF